MDHCDPRFRELLGRFDTDVFETCESSVYGMWPDFGLAYLNRAWFRFAAENGGEPRISTEWGLGADVMRAIDEPLRTYFRTALRGCFEDGRPWSHRYECSSATRFREYHMRVYPLRRDAGYLVMHSLVVQRPHDPVTHAPVAVHDHRFTNGEGAIVQCMHCRRIRRNDEDVWDWVPEWVEHRPENTTGSLCQPCYDFHFGGHELPAS